MIKEDYVSFETAKLLKEKGFNIPYDSFRGVFINGKFLRHNPGQGYLHNIGDEIIEVCSLQMAMKWLREVHHIFLSIQQHMDMSYVWYAYVDGAAKGCDRESHNNTYEEACETAIKYCLENLI